MCSIHTLWSHGWWRKGLAWLGVGQVHNEVCSRDRGLQSSETWTKHGINREALVGSKCPKVTRQPMVVLEFHEGMATAMAMRCTR